LFPHRTLIGEAEQTLLLLYSCSAKGLLWPSPFNYEQVWPKIIRLLKSSVSDGEVSQERYDDFKRNWRFFSEPPPRDRLQDSLKNYFATLKNRRLVDYPSLTRDLLAWLKRKRRKATAVCFDAVVVDEFQDTNRAQAELLLLLSGRKKNIWLVGDPCQQIYEWRSADAGTLAGSRSRPARSAIGSPTISVRPRKFWMVHVTSWAEAFPRSEEMNSLAGYHRHGTEPSRLRPDIQFIGGLLPAPSR